MIQKVRRYLSKPCVAVIALVLLYFSTTAQLQIQPGTITVTGKVKVNRRYVPTGFPIWSGTTVETQAKGSSAVVSLGKLGRLDFQEGSEANIEFNDKRIVVTMLEAGRVRLATPAGVGARVRSVEAQVTADATQANEFSVDTSCGNIIVVTKTGQVTLQTGGRNPIVKEILAGSTETVGTPNKAGCE
jgi:hypothetical protein